LRFLIQKNMRENLRVFGNKIISTLKNSAYILIPAVMLLSVGIIALTQEEPFQTGNLSGGSEVNGLQPDSSSAYEKERVIPEWVKPERWFRSNSGGMPLEEMKSKIAAMRSEYALVIDFTDSSNLPASLLDYYEDNLFIELRALYKNGRQDRTQWIFRDENFGVRLIAVLFEAKHESGDGKENRDSEIIGAKTGSKPGSISGFIEIYDDKYHLTTEYRYSDKGEKTKIEYSYNGNIKISARTMLWDENKRNYIQTYTDYYRYNRSSFLRAVERVFSKDQQITSADNAVTDSEVTDDTVVKVSFPPNILAAAKSRFTMSEKYNAYPDFFGEIFVLKDSKLVFSTDEHGRVKEQTLFSDDEEKTIIWKIENTWSKDRIVKITKTEGENVLLAEYEYNRNGDRVLERNFYNGVLERVVRSDGKTDIEELYLDNKLVLKAVWEDGRKISESRVNVN